MKNLIAYAAMSAGLGVSLGVAELRAPVWTECAPLPLPRAGYASGVLASGLVIAGGSYWKNNKKIRVTRVDVYHADCNCWHEAPSMPVALAGSASAVHNGKLFVLGGKDAESAIADVFSFDGTAWKAETGMKLPEPRTNGMAAFVGSKLVLFGGLAQANSTTSGLRTAWVWDQDHPQAGWVPLPGFPGEPRASAAVAVQGESVIVAGGLRADTATVENLADIWRFDFHAQQWSRIGELPEGRRAFSAVAIGNEIVTAGGYTTGFRNDVLVLENGHAKYIGALPVAVADATLQRMDGRLYLAGGEIGPKARGAKMWSAPLKEQAE